MHVATRSMWLMLSLALMGLVVAPAAAQADDWTPGHYMEQALSTVKGSVLSVMGDSDLGLDEGTCVFGALLQPESSVSVEYEFERGVTYAVLGGGDEDAVDLDIEILGPGGEVLAVDNEPDAVPIAVFTPDSHMQATVVLSLYGQEVPSFTAMVVLREGGRQVPEGSMDQAMDAFFELCAGQASDTNAIFHEEPGHWCLYGAIVEPGGSAWVRSLPLQAGSHMLLGAGDSDLTDLDMFFYEGDDLFGDDTLPDAIPVVFADTGRGSNFQLELSCASAETWGFALMGVLDVP